MAIPPNFYNVADQKLYKEGLFYKPQERFTLPYNQASLDDENSVEPEGILSANVVNNFTNNGGSGFSVYNPDPNSIVNRDYRPNYDYRKSVDYNPELSDLQNQKIMQGTANFKGYDYYNKPEPTGAAKFMGAITNLMPGRGIAQFLGNYLPTNRRSIMENELSRQGVMVNNIGQIVSDGGNINTAENIMAGYNPNKMTAETFDKRISKIQDTLEKKYGSRTYTGDKTKLDERIKAIEEAKTNFLNADDESEDIYNFKKKQKQIQRDKTVIGRYLNKRDRVALAKEQINPTGPSNSKRGTPGGSADRFTKDGGMTYDNSQGDFRNIDGSNVNQDFKNTSASLDNYDPSVLYADGGRIGYFFGGLAARGMKR